MNKVQVQNHNQPEPFIHQPGQIYIHHDGGYWMMTGADHRDGYNFISLKDGEIYSRSYYESPEAIFNATTLQSTIGSDSRIVGDFFSH